MTQLGLRLDSPAGWRFLLPAMIKLGLAWVFLGIVLTVTSLFSLVTLRIGVGTYAHLIIRFCAGVILKMAGIEVRLVNGERIQGRKTRLVSFNHSSQLDLFIMATVMPPYGTPIGKWEFYLVPFFGWFFFAMKLLVVNRSSLKQSKLTLAVAGRRMNEERATVFIAPEGTRSRDGKLGAFKMGTFHLAHEARVPITPAVVRGAHACQPLGIIIPRPGLVVIEFLPDFPTDDFRADNLKQKRDELREVYVRALAPPPAEARHDQEGTGDNQ